MKRFATALLIIGGLNWLLVGLFQFDLVASLFGGTTSLLSRIVYTLVGLSAIYAISFLPKIDRRRELTGESETTIKRAA